MDDELRAAYERLTEAALPPVDARELVAAQIGRRRRRRASGYAALALLVVVGAGGVATRMGDREGGDNGAADSASEPPEPSPSITLLPTEVTCARDERPTGVDYNHAGYETLDDLLTAEARDLPLYGVDREAGMLWGVRPDGSAYRQVPFSGQRGDRWFPDGMVHCGEPPPVATPVTVDCTPTSWAFTDSSPQPTLTDLTGRRSYLHDVDSAQVYFIGDDGRFVSTLRYRHDKQGWWLQQMGRCD